jgi:hypothetical protein
MEIDYYHKNYLYFFAKSFQKVVEAAIKFLKCSRIHSDLRSSDSPFKTGWILWSMWYIPLLEKIISSSLQSRLQGPGKNLEPPAQNISGQQRSSKNVIAFGLFSERNFKKR